MHSYSFFYWGPLLFKTKMLDKDLKKCAKLCSKQSDSARGILAGVIKYEQYVNIPKRKQQVLKDKGYVSK